MQRQLIPLSACRQIDLSAAVSGGKFIAQIFHGVRVSVYQKDSAGRKPFQKREDLRSVSVGGQPHLFDAAADRNFVSVQDERFFFRMIQKV